MSTHPYDPDAPPPHAATVPEARSLSKAPRVSATLDPALEAALQHPAGSSASGERFHHEGILAEGGLGAVHSVFDKVLKRTIAVKRLHDTMHTSVGSAFLREARILARLDHPCIIPVYDYGVDSKFRPYIVMKQVEGEDFASWNMAVGTPRTPEAQVRLVELFRRVCDALAFAHARGVLHNDLKPSNLMLGDHGEIYVVDWGNAVRRTQWKRGLGHVTGTPAYMSPEQARCESLSPATDVFGIGATLFAMLVGCSPRARDPQLALKEAWDQTPILPPENHIVPKGIMDILLRAMAPLPEDRPATIQELSEQLDRARLGTWTAPRVHIPAGKTVVREGETGDQAYVVEAGKLEVVRSDKGLVSTIGPGDVFGELAPLTRRARTSTVRALTPCTLAVIDGRRLRSSLDMGNVGGRFVAALASRLVQEDAERD